MVFCIEAIFLTLHINRVDGQNVNWIYCCCVFDVWFLNIASTVKQNPKPAFYLWFRFPIRPIFACEWKSLIKEIRDFMTMWWYCVDCVAPAICWPHLTPTVTRIWLQNNVVFLGKGNFTLTCKAQSAAAWECGKVQAWVISRHREHTDRAIKCVCWADMKAYRNSPQLWQKIRLVDSIVTWTQICTAVFAHEQTHTSMHKATI